MFEIKETKEYKKWFNKLNASKVKNKINVRVRRIEVQEYFGDYKIVDDGIYELRVNYGPGYRVYYKHISKKTILLLIGGNKTTQKSDIKKAKQISADYY